VERYDPDLWNDEFAFLNQPGQIDIQSDLFYDYRTNVEPYPKWQAWMREQQPRLLVIWGKYDLSFDPGEPERYRKGVPNAQVHVLDAGHFALDTAADDGSAALAVSPRIGHIHVTVDNAPWHWADASGNAVIINGLPAGDHKILIQLVNANHQPIDQGIVMLTMPAAKPHSEMQ
jgi:hypothetical protein